MMPGLGDKLKLRVRLLDVTDRTRNRLGTGRRTEAIKGGSARRLAADTRVDSAIL